MKDDNNKFFKVDDLEKDKEEMIIIMNDMFTNIENYLEKII